MPSWSGFYSHQLQPCQAIKGRCLTGRGYTLSRAVPASPWRCSGRNIDSPTRKAFNTAGESRRPGVTLALLWQEYRLAHPQGFQYSWFCEHYRLWAAKVDVVMRQEHRAGEKLFVDYAGQTAPIIDRSTGEIRQAQIFVAVLGASSYTFAEATWSQKLPDWLGSHVRCF
ncbi:ISPsy14, transposase, partial [Pseudomonas syringae pv. actinidiae ICMP 9855]